MTTIFKTVVVAIGMIGICKTCSAQHVFGDDRIIGERPSVNRSEPNHNKDAPDRDRSIAPNRSVAHVTTKEEKIEIEVKKRMANLDASEKASLRVIGYEKMEKRIRDQVELDFINQELKEKEAAQKADQERRIREENDRKEKERISNLRGVDGGDRRN